MTVEQQLSELGAELRRLHASMDQQNSRSQLIQRQLRQFEQQLTRQLESLLADIVTRALPEGASDFGALVSQLAVPRFADGGIVEGPGLVALAGEAGPEAVLPLKRGADGQLGVGVVSPETSSMAPMPPVNVDITLANGQDSLDSELSLDTQLLDGLSAHLSAALAQAVSTQIEERFAAIGGAASPADLHAQLRTIL